MYSRTDRWLLAAILYAGVFTIIAVPTVALAFVLYVVLIT